MREIDDTAERKDQREAERDQQVIGADQKAVKHLLEDKDELHAHWSQRLTPKACTRLRP